MNCFVAYVLLLPCSSCTHHPHNRWWRNTSRKPSVQRSAEKPGWAEGHLGVIFSNPPKLVYRVYIGTSIGNRKLTALAAKQSTTVDGSRNTCMLDGRDMPKIVCCAVLKLVSTLETILRVYVYRVYPRLKGESNVYRWGRGRV